MFPLDCSSLTDGATITSADLLLRTAQVISNTADEAPVDFSGFTGNGSLEFEDFTEPADLLVAHVFELPVNQNVDLEISLTNIAPLNAVLTDGDTEDFLTVRSETVNFVSFHVDALESTDSDAIPAALRVTFVGGVILGDVNGDCSVDLLDVAGFVALIQDGIFQEEGDINEDGQLICWMLVPLLHC